MNTPTAILPGLYYGLSNEEYHAGPGVSNSMLSDLAKSPAHFYAMNLAPGRPRRETTPAMRAGTLAHTGILEPQTLAKRYITRPDGLDGRTTKGKDWLAAVPDGVEVITAEQSAAAQSQRDAFMADPDLAELLRVGHAEVSAYWVDEQTGLLCRCRPDWVHPIDDNNVILLDVKSTNDVTDEGFRKSIGAFNYHRQQAWYTRGFEKATGLRVAGFIFGAVSSSYPFLAVPYLLRAEAVQQGDEECDELLQQYAQCLKSNRWPVHGGGYQEIDLPRWKKRDAEVELAWS